MLPRLRVLALGLLVLVASLGLGAGLAWRWAVRDAVRRRAGLPVDWRGLWSVDQAGVHLLGLVSLPLLLAPYAARSPVFLGIAAGLLALHHRFGVTTAVGPDIAPPTDRRAWLLPWAVQVGLLALTAVWVVPAVLERLDRLVDFDPPTLRWLVSVVAVSAASAAVGALAAVPFVARRCALRPAAPLPAAPRFVVERTVAACALFAAWALGVSLLVVPLSRSPFLRSEVDVGNERCGGGAQTLELPDGSVSWSEGSNSFDRHDWVIGLYRAPAAAGSALQTADVPTYTRDVVVRGDRIALVALDPEGRAEVVLYGGDLRRHEVWQLPRGIDGALLEADPGGGLIAGWRVGRTLHLTLLGPRLEPSGRSVRVRLPRAEDPVPRFLPVEPEGDLACLYVGDPHYPSLLAFEAGLRRYAPSFWQRAWGRSPEATVLFAVLGLVGAALVLGARRGGRLLRALQRAERDGSLRVGHATGLEQPARTALFRGADGTSFRLDLGTVQHSHLGGDAPAFADGPCVVLDAALPLPGEPYRGEPPLVSRAVLVPGALAAAQRAAASRATTAWAGALGLAWMLGAQWLLWGNLALLALIVLR